MLVNKLHGWNASSRTLVRGSAAFSVSTSAASVTAAHKVLDLPSQSLRLAVPIIPVLSREESPIRIRDVYPRSHGFKHFDIPLFRASFPGLLSWWGRYWPHLPSSSPAIPRPLPAIYTPALCNPQNSLGTSYRTLTYSIIELNEVRRKHVMGYDDVLRYLILISMKTPFLSRPSFRAAKRLKPIRPTFQDLQHTANPIRDLGIARP